MTGLPRPYRGCRWIAGARSSAERPFRAASRRKAEQLASACAGAALKGNAQERSQTSRWPSCGFGSKDEKSMTDSASPPGS